MIKGKLSKTNFVINKNTMKIIILIFSIFLNPFIFSINCWSQITTQKYLLAGSDNPKSNTCNDSCIIVYMNYSVITKTHPDSPGEDIIVVNDSTKSRLNIDVQSDYHAQYFCGLVGDNLLIDVGTSIVRTNIIYNLKKKCIIDSVRTVFDGAKLINGKLYYTTIMAEDRVKKLNLPLCDYTNLEFNGYIEYMYFDFKTEKRISLEKYKCIK